MYYSERKRVAPREEEKKARESPWNDVAEKLKSAIETRQDQGPSGHWRMRLTIEIVLRIEATPGCSGCARSRSHTEACRVRSRRTLADAKESESSRAVGAGVGSIAKMIVEPQQPTAVMQQEPSPSPLSSPTAMQEPTQNIQNEQMDSPMEMGAQQMKVRLNETSSSEMSKRPVVKAKPAHSPTIAPMMERLGSTVLLDPAPSSKDKATTGSLYAIDGIDVVTALVPEEDVWQYEVTKTCAREIQFQDGEQESVAIVNHEDPSVSKTINVCETRTGEKLDPKEMQKRKAKEVQELDEFEVKVKVVKSEARVTPGKKVWSKWVETRKDPNKPWYESSGLSHREGGAQSESRTKCTKRCGWSSGYFEPHPRQRSLQRVLLANASFADSKARRNRDNISFYVVTPKDLRRKRKIWSLLKNRCGVRDTGQVFAAHVEEDPNEYGLQKDALVPWWYWKATLKTCSVYWGDGFTPAISGVRANDLEQLMRETFRVKVGERVDPGFLTTVEVLRRKVAWNVEDFFRIYDPMHTLAFANEFGFVGKKQLEQTKSILVTPGSKTMNNGVRDGADVLDERETRQCRSLFGTALNDGQDRPETQYTTEESARFVSDPTRAVKCMFKRLCKLYSEATRAQLEFSTSRNAVRGQSGERGILGKGIGGTVDDGRLDFVLVVICWRRILRHSRLWRCLLRRVRTFRQKMLLMLWRSLVLWRSAT